MEDTVRGLLAQFARSPTLVFPDLGAVEDGPRPFRLRFDTNIDSFRGALEQAQQDSQRTTKNVVYVSRATLDPERLGIGSTWKVGRSLGQSTFSACISR